MEHELERRLVIIFRDAMKCSFYFRLRRQSKIVLFPIFKETQIRVRLEMYVLILKPMGLLNDAVSREKNTCGDAKASSVFFALA
jgi:hypothetical protein